jgi:hypothetical protein
MDFESAELPRVAALAVRILLLARGMNLMLPCSASTEAALCASGKAASMGPLSLDSCSGFRRSLSCCRRDAQPTQLLIASFGTYGTCMEAIQQLHCAVSCDPTQQFFINDSGDGIPTVTLCPALCDSVYAACNATELMGLPTVLLYPDSRSFCSMLTISGVDGFDSLSVVYADSDRSCLEETKFRRVERCPVANGHECNGHGACDDNTRTCKCDSGYKGRACRSKTGKMTFERSRSERELKLRRQKRLADDL